MLARRAKESPTSKSNCYLSSRETLSSGLLKRAPPTLQVKNLRSKFMVFFGNTRAEFRFLRGRRSAMIAGCAHMPPAW